AAELTYYGSELSLMISLASLFSILDFHNIVVDLIATSEVHVSTAIPKLHQFAACALKAKRSGSLGRQMRNMVGIAAKMFSTLANANINIEMISQGSSEINISCVIDQDHSLLALNEIHRNILEWEY
ncbi:Aspartokinase, partial [Massospora cicadina]